MQEYMSLATQLTTLTILHVATKCYSGQLALLLTASYRMWGAYATSDMMLMSLCETYYVEESGHMRLASYIGT